ncbi:MAG: nitrate ABC transporter permease, partial [Sulfuricella sp.]
MNTILKTLLPPLIGMMLFVGIWALVAQTTPTLPGPVKTWSSAVQLFSDPFYQKGPNDQGIGWNILA